MIDSMKKTEVNRTNSDLSVCIYGEAVAKARWSAGTNRSHCGYVAHAKEC